MNRWVTRRQGDRAPTGMSIRATGEQDSHAVLHIFGVAQTRPVAALPAFRIGAGLVAPLLPQPASFMDSSAGPSVAATTVGSASAASPRQAR
jgi:hypothetical protein